MSFPDLINDLSEAIKNLAVHGLRNADFKEIEEVYKKIKIIDPPAPAISKLRDSVLALLESREDSTESFLKLNELLMKIRISLMKTHSEEDYLPIQERAFVKYENVKYSEVGHLLEALKTKSGNRLDVLRAAIANDRFRYEQLLPYYVDNIEERVTDLSRLIIKEILPSFGVTAVPLLEKRLFGASPGVKELILEFLIRHMDIEDIKSLSEKIADSGDLVMIKAFLGKAALEHLNEIAIAKFKESRSREVKDLLRSLVEKNP